MRSGSATHQIMEAPRSFDNASRQCHFERSREISIAVRGSACIRHFINDVFVLHLSVISHRLLTVVQERSLDFARDDDTGESQSLVTPNPQSLIPSYQSLVPSHQPLTLPTGRVPSPIPCGKHPLSVSPKEARVRFRVSVHPARFPSPAPH